MDAAALGLAAEALLQVAQEVTDRRARRELLHQRQQAREVGLARQLLLAEPAGRVGDPALSLHDLRDRAERRGVLPSSQQPQRPPRGRPLDERRAAHLERDPGEREGLLVVLRARVQAVEHRHLLVRDALAGEAPHLADDELGLGQPVGLHQGQRLLAAGPDGAQHLLRAAQLGHEPVRDREDLRRRAVVLLEPHDERAGKARGHRQEILRRRARERVDRLVVVADDAEVVAVAEPALEERLLQQVDVLVLVDRERAVALAEGRQRRLVLVEQADRQLEQVFEVDEPAFGLPRLVGAKDALHQVVRERRLVVAELAPVGRRGQAPVLRPLDLRGEVGQRPEAERAGQRPRDRQQHRRLRREQLAELLAAEVAELGERGRVEGARGDAGDAQARQPRAHLGRRLVREGDGEDLAGRERSRRDLVRDPPRDRRRLARARAREDADRPAHGLDRAPLLGVELGEDVLQSPERD